MFKKIGFIAAALALCAVGVFANGCSSSTTSSVGPTDDGGNTTKDSGPVKDSGPGAGDSGPATCYDISTAFALNFGAPVAYQGVCTPTQVAGYITACFSPGTTATCTTFVDANPNCAICIDGSGPAADSGVVFDAGPNYDGGLANIPYPVVVPVDQNSNNAVSNIDGCIAALTTGTTDACKLADDRLSNCIESSCSSCTAGDNAAQTACLNAAQADTSGCSSTYVVDSTCQTALTASQTANAAACGANATTFQDQFTAVANTLCGAHP